MAKKSIGTQDCDEVKVRRLLALLEKEFGPIEGARPKLRLVVNNGAPGASKAIEQTQAAKQAKKRRLLTVLEQEFGPVAAGARPRPFLIVDNVGERA